MEKKNAMSRRDFLKKSAVGAVTLGVAGGVLREQALGANEKVGMAVIGVGGMGGGHVGELMRKKDRVRLLAVCDVWEKRREQHARRSGATPYADYREVIERKDIDAVVIATPDHWHATISIDAMEAGKDVYCQKPITRYWWEAKEVVEVVHRTKRVFQCGAQGTSDGALWRAKQLIQDGAIGKVIWAQSTYCRNDPGGDWNYYIDPSANPSNLDWDMWLGPARKRPWSPERFFRFRKYWDYSGGVATDLLYHRLAELTTALGREFPLEVVATGGNYVHKEREVPDTFHVLIKYPSDCTVFLVSTQENDDGLERVIRGQHATLGFGGPGVVVRPQSVFREKMTAKVNDGVISVPGLEAPKDSKGNVEEIRVPEMSVAGHMDDFLNCIKSREKPHLDADSAYRVMVAIALSIDSYREKKVKIFDPVAEEVVV
jgi:predicted dehydrogenase